MDTFTKRTTVSYGQNIGNSFFGIIMGLLLLVGSVVLLWWNEGRSLKQADALTEMKEKTVVLSNTAYNPEYNGRPVWLYGEIKPTKMLHDTLFMIDANALVLSRKVEMYQWSERKETREENKLGGGTERVTTYTYEKRWREGRIASESFEKQEEHINPQLPYRSDRFISDAHVGDFYLATNVISHINASEQLNLGKFPSTIGEVKNYRTFLYRGENPQEPKVGDVKITYSQAPGGVYSLYAKQEMKSLVSFHAENGNQLLFIERGKVSAQEMLEGAQSINTLITWGVRVGGLVLMFIGFMLIMGPLTALANVVPVFGSLVGGVSAIIASVLTLVIGSVVIAVAWFSVRPFTSLAILAVGIGLAYGIAKLKKSKNGPTEAPAAATPPPRK